MNKIYIIAKNEHGNPKTPVRWGVQGGGGLGYCLNNGQIVCFATFDEASRVLMSFDEPHWYDIITYSFDFNENSRFFGNSII